ncbi:hypothetical protein SeMB42_g06213 [Synchytrium endobioticum]|uniref:Inositol hexakisphosphate and diphosphoinositol-pentakisphosphate kinase n=1 Tax=Synchytrium endobioticum TaxID=286115 RepID=A0A507CZG2_9FUNG|nr:hypothetical protein SeMB42_g06213 [Synchytrium endobioticum]TPX44563.1 hypothetical protein SeLEV6574_g04429 [Synchytrium endobioticum]
MTTIVGPGGSIALSRAAPQGSSKYIIGICAMDSKARSKPMRNILNILLEKDEFDMIVFGDKVILDEDVENWPYCDFFVSFFSTGFPLQKAIDYVKSRKPFCINNLPMQQLLLDRRLVLTILEAIHVPTPSRLTVNRDTPLVSKDVVDLVRKCTGADISPNAFKCSHAVMVDTDTLEVDGVRLRKPFVEKPVSGEDHNIYIYFAQSAGGGCRRLFRKIGNKSSDFDPNVVEIRRDGSFIYEQFVSVDNAEDVKVYTIGENYVHAETRKSPVVDGVVSRTPEGKEIRYITQLSSEERDMARRVTRAFRQSVCGFDLLRANGRSYCIDVNGWSFVKGNQEYYETCANIMRHLFFEASKRRRYVLDRGISGTENQWQLKAFLTVLRHGDRTPKQKMKFSFKSPPLVALLNGGDDEVVLKKPAQVRRVREACYEAIEAGIDDPIALEQMKQVLEAKGDLPETKVQIRPTYKKSDKKVLDKLQLIVKWGGEFTHGGQLQSQDLAENYRKDLLIINRSLLDDVKMYTSSERRVISTADIFARVFLDVASPHEDLITVSKEMLDDSNAAKEQMDNVKLRLQAILNRQEEYEFPQSVTSSHTAFSASSPHLNGTNHGSSTLYSTSSSSSTASNQDLSLYSSSPPPGSSAGVDRNYPFFGPPCGLGNPADLVDDVIHLISQLREIMQQNYETKDVASIQTKWCCFENPSLFKERWERLFRDFCDVPRSSFDPSKVSELYDSLKYDLLHNLTFCDGIFASDIEGREVLRSLYAKSKTLFDFVGPQEFGIGAREKLDIGILHSHDLLRQIRQDLLSARSAPGPLTRIYFTKESKVITLLNIVLLCGLPTKLTGFEVDNELDYLTQITFELYERVRGCASADLDAREYSLRIGFSQGAHDPNLVDLRLDDRHSISVAPRRFISDHINLDEALSYLPTSLSAIPSPR